jgi:type IV pilus assembly protein PilA
MLKRLRERAGSEKGFTLIELLVVMLILGILAAIAIPAFLNQRGKANDATMKAQARTMQTAIETYATDNNTYVGATCLALNRIEPTIPNPCTNPPDTLSVNGYRVRSNAATGTGNIYRITRAAGGAFTRDCVLGAQANAAGCNIGAAAPAAGVVGNW